MSATPPYSSTREHLRDLLESVRLRLLHVQHVRQVAAQQTEAPPQVAMSLAFLTENAAPHRVPMDATAREALERGPEHIGARAAATEQGTLRWRQLVEGFGVTDLEERLLLTAVAPHFSTEFAEAFSRLVPGHANGRIPASALADLASHGDPERWAALEALHPDGFLARAGLVISTDPGLGRALPFPQALIWASPVLVEHVLTDAPPARRPASLGGLARFVETERSLDSLPLAAESRAALRGLASAVDEAGPPRGVSAVITGGLLPEGVAEAVALEAGRDLLLLTFVAPDPSPEAAAGYRQVALYAALNGLLLAVVLPQPEALTGGALEHLLEHTAEAPHLLVVAAEPVPALSRLHDVPLRTVRLPPMTERERRWAWADGLGARAVEAEALDQVAASFSLSELEIREVSGAVLAEARLGETPLAYGALAAKARVRLSAGLQGVAERLETDRDAAALVVSEECRAELDGIASYLVHLGEVERRHQIVPNRGRGTSVLFHGPSGTGKTFAATVIARQTHRDLYRINTAQVVDKYIGETEKKLDRVFSVAEASGSIILFDEADSLFAKRSTSVNSSTDRYANMQVNFLLQRLESYRGMSILTTNLLDGIDQAFRRRLQFQIHFPLPVPETRVRLWQQFLGQVGSPSITEDELWELGEDFDMSGAHIRNAVIKAAVMASSLGRDVQAGDLFDAAQLEYRSLGGLVRSTRRAE